VSTGRFFIFSTVCHFEEPLASVTPHRRVADLTRIVFHSQGRVADFFCELRTSDLVRLFHHFSPTSLRRPSSWITNFGRDSTDHEPFRKGRSSRSRLHQRFPLLTLGVALAKKFWTRPALRRHAVRPRPPRTSRHPPRDALLQLDRQKMGWGVEQGAATKGVSECLEYL
jgi:hypothetical protein